MVNKRQFIIVVFSLVLILFGSNATFSFENEPNGFKGINWGTYASELDKLNYMIKHPRIEDAKIFCEKKDLEQGLGHGGCSVYYYFWNNRFYSGMILITGYDNFIAFREETFNKYGEVTETKDDTWEMRYLWNGETTFIQLGYDENTTQGQLRMESKEIMSEIKRAIENQKKD